MCVLGPIPGLWHVNVLACALRNPKAQQTGPSPAPAGRTTLALHMFLPENRIENLPKHDQDLPVHE